MESCGSWNAVCQHFRYCIIRTLEMLSIIALMLLMYCFPRIRCYIYVYVERLVKARRRCILVSMQEIKIQRRKREGTLMMPQSNKLFLIAGNLKKMLQKVVESKNEDEQIKNFDAIQEIITNVQFAFDEGDHGEFLFAEYRQ